MTRWGCKFCIVLYGVNPARVRQFPDRSYEGAWDHVRRKPGYPGRSAADILGNTGKRGLAARLIEVSGPVVAITAPDLETAH